MNTYEETQKKKKDITLQIIDIFNQILNEGRASNSYIENYKPTAEEKNLIVNAFKEEAYFTEEEYREFSHNLSWSDLEYIATNFLEKRFIHLPYAYLLKDRKKSQLINSPYRSVKFILQNETAIIGLAIEKIKFLRSKEDTIFDSLNEAVSSLQDGRYIAAQAVLKDILELFRKTRLSQTYIAGIYDEYQRVPLTKSEYISFVEFLKNKGYSEAEIDIASIMILPFAQTFSLIEKGYDPSVTPNRHGSAHVGRDYYSRYNALAFSLIVIQLIDFCYLSNSKYAVPQKAWNSYQEEYAFNNGESNNRIILFDQIPDLIKAANLQPWTVEDNLSRLVIKASEDSFTILAVNSKFSNEDGKTDTWNEFVEAVQPRFYILSESPSKGISSRNFFKIMKFALLEKLNIDISPEKSLTRLNTATLFVYEKQLRANFRRGKELQGHLLWTDYKSLSKARLALVEE